SPPPPVERRERTAPPAQPVVTHRLSRLHAHHYCGILFDFADLTKLDVFGEAAHERGAEAGAAEVPGAETRKKEKQHATKNDGSGGHAKSGKTQRAIQSSIAPGVQMESRRDGSDGSAAYFHSNESGNTKQEKDEKKNEEGGIDGKNGHGKNTRKREQREKQRI